MKESTKPIILHAHIPKTAGQSLIALFQQSFGVHHFIYYDKRPDHYWSADDLHKIVADNTELMAISSHSIRNFPTEIAGRPALYVTFLREPTAAFISLLKYTRKTFQEQSDEVRALWPSNTPDLSLRDLAVHQLKRQGRSPQICLQPRFFCHPSNYSYPMNCDGDGSGVNNFLGAVRTLDRFFFVGIVELFDRSIRLLRQKLLPFGISLRVDQIPVKNENKVAESELFWLNEADEVGRQALTCNCNDYRLYQRYRGELEKEPECAEFRPGNDACVELVTITNAQVSQAISEFSTWEYRRINARRLEHLASLGLPLTNRRVWEVSAGIGDLTDFFLDRECKVRITEIRPALLGILRDRFPGIEIMPLDLEDPPPQTFGLFEVVFCSGTLYHVRDPGDAIAFLASCSEGLLILETCVSRGDDLAINLVEENSQFYTQAFHGMGCRPTRNFVFEELKKHFPHVYVSAEQPRHEEFPIDWKHKSELSSCERSVFVASRTPIQSSMLIAGIPRVQKYQA
jgi:hypothetical protein